MPSHPEVRELLEQAAFDGNLAELARLLDSGAAIDAEGRNWNPLHAAVENGQDACVKLLLERGADINRLAGKLTPLAHAVDIAIDGAIQTGGAQGDEPTGIIALLLAAGADPEPGLVVAKRYGSRKLIEILENA